ASSRIHHAGDALLAHASLVRLLAIPSRLVVVDLLALTSLSLLAHALVARRCRRCPARHAAVLVGVRVERRRLCCALVGRAEQIREEPANSLCHHIPPSETPIAPASGTPSNVSAIHVAPLPLPTVPPVGVASSNLTFTDWPRASSCI